MEIKITKTEKLQEINNSMVHNFYYLIHGRIYNDEKTRYKKFKFVLFFDAFDIQEYFTVYAYIFLKSKFFAVGVFFTVARISFIAAFNCFNDSL